MKYKCPHCGKVIEEVSVVEFTLKKTGIACGLGVGCGLVFYALAPQSLLIGTIGAFIVGFIIVFLMIREKAK